MYPHGVCVDFEAGRIVDTERSYLDQNEDDQYHFQVRAEHLDNDTLFPTPMDDATSPNESDFSLNGSMPPPCGGPIGWNHQQPVDVLIMPLEVAPGNPLCFDPSLTYPFLSGPSESPIDFPNPNPYRALSLSTQGARRQPVQDSLAASLESDWEFVENWLRKEEMLPLPDQFPSCTPHQLITPRTPSPSSVPPALTPASTDTSSTTLSSPDPSTMNCFQLPVYLQEQQSSPSHVESVRARPGKAKTPEKNRKPGLSFAGPATSCPPSGHMMAPRTPSPPPFWLSPPSLTPTSTHASSSVLSTPDSSTMAGSQLPIYIRQQGSPTCVVEPDRVGRGRVQKDLRASAAKPKEAAAKVKSKPRRRKQVGADSQNATVAGSASEAQPRQRRIFTSKLEDIRGYQFMSFDHRFQCQWQGTQGTCGVYFRDEEHLRQHLRADPLKQGGHGLLLGKESNGVTVCLWEGCGKPMTASRRRRHIDAKHLGVRFQCVKCKKVLARVQSPTPKCKNGGTCEYKNINIRSPFDSPPAGLPISDSVI